MHHFSQKSKQNKVAKNISDYLNNKKIDFWKKNILKILGGSVFLKFQNFVQKCSISILWLCSGKFDNNLMGQSKGYSANNFRGHPPLGATLRAKIFLRL